MHCGTYDLIRSLNYVSAYISKVRVDIIDKKSVASVFFAVARVMGKDYVQHSLVVLGDLNYILGKCGRFKLCAGSGVLTYHDRIRQISFAIRCG